MGILDMLGRGGGPQEDPPVNLISAPPPGPDEMLAKLSAAGIGTQQVPGFLAREGDHYVDASGNPLIGAPDANGMAVQPINADGSLASPNLFAMGPPYSDSVAPYTGGAPMTYNDTGAGHDSGVPDDWQNYKGNATTGGGFFTLDDVFKSQGKDVPTAFQSGSNMASTNNYRLLPPEYRKPNYIMRNGRIIDLNDAYGMYGPQGMGSPADPKPRWNSGAGIGVPVAWSQGTVGWGMGGWPGQQGNYIYWGPGT